MQHEPDERTADCAVSLLEDEASLWPSIKRLIDGRIRTGREGSSIGPIGLFCWPSATTDRTERIAALRARHPGPLVGVLGDMPSARAARTLAAQIEGVVLAGTLEQSLLPTIAAVAAGQCVVPPALRQIVNRPPLSPRERQILAMVVLGLSNAEIADKLLVSQSNVKNHLSSAFKKLGVDSRSAAAELILNAESGLGLGILRISADEALPGVG